MFAWCFLLGLNAGFLAINCSLIADRLGASKTLLLNIFLTVCARFLSFVNLSMRFSASRYNSERKV
jgi:hypothetical protein